MAQLSLAYIKDLRELCVPGQPGCFPWRPHHPRRRMILMSPRAREMRCSSTSCHAETCGVCSAPAQKKVDNNNNTKVTISLHLHDTGPFFIESIFPSACIQKKTDTPAIVLLTQIIIIMSLPILCTSMLLLFGSSLVTSPSITVLHARDRAFLLVVWERLRWAFMSARASENFRGCLPQSSLKKIGPNPISPGNFRSSRKIFPWPKWLQSWVAKAIYGNLNFGAIWAR